MMGSDVPTDMLEELTAECRGCSRSLEAEDATLVFRTEDGEQRAYDCACGAVTITVHR